MKEYIDRDAAINTVRDHWLDSSRTLAAIENIPAAGVVEVVHAKWNIEIDEDIGILKHTCSKCGFVKFTDIHVGLNWNWCPNCGVKLDLEE